MPLKIASPRTFGLASCRAKRTSSGTDCASLVERLGVEVRVCAGRVDNFKVTHPDDLARAEALLAARGGSS